MLFAAVVGVEDGLMQLFERLVAPDLDHATDLLAGELLAERAALQVDRHDVQVCRRCRRGRDNAAGTVVRTRRAALRLAGVPRRDLVLRDQDPERTGLTRLA